MAGYEIIENDNSEKEKDSENLNIKVKPTNISEVMEPRNFEYNSTRLSFRKAIIDEMKDYDILTINVLGAQNPDNNGKFKMTKRQIYQTFDNVIKSDAYQRDGNYNYKKTPQKAQIYNQIR